MSFYFSWEIALDLAKGMEVAQSTMAHSWLNQVDVD